MLSPGNPFASSSDPNKRRIIAYGLRNPFRFDVRPGTNELWVGDVGWSTWEEINRVANIGDATVENFGWPCYEGSRAPKRLRRGKPAHLRGAVPGERGRHRSRLHLQPLRQRCVGRRLSDRWLVDRRHRVLSRVRRNVSRRHTEAGSSSPTTPGTASGGWPRVPNGQPDPATRAVFVSPAAGPVDLEVGPRRSALLRRFQRDRSAASSSRQGNQPPTAFADAAPTSGPAPLTVSFDGRNSTDPESGTLVVRMGSRRRWRLR